MKNKAEASRAVLKVTEMYNVGRAKYVVNYHTGKKHDDGSDFYDIAIFKNKRKKDDFVKSLHAAHEANRQPVFCPKCHEPVWDVAFAHKLNKCWNCMFAFD